MIRSRPDLRKLWRRIAGFDILRVGMNRRTVVAAALGSAAILGAAFLLPRRTTPTFHEDIAPLLAGHCAPCHLPGGAGPFPLTSYADAKARAGQIADLTQRRVMPPWMPDQGCGDFVGDRSLSSAQIDRIRRWVDGGAPEGDPSKAPPPAATDAGPARAPDLVVTLPEPYPLAAEGTDLYRNFVVPIPVESRRYVRAVEFRPDNPRTVHHAFLYIDPTRESQRLDLKDPAPGFPGIHVPASAQAPPGRFLSWQPGKVLVPEPEDMAWPLEKGCSLVLQLHLKPSGKPELVRPSVAFFFTDRPPTRTPVKFGLWSYDIDIPAGDPAHQVRDSFTVPLDLDLLRVLPHAHHLARKLEGTATFPDGTSRCLLRINAWDFNWQGDYAYKTPIFLPKGTVVSMVFTYDNSDANPRNPHRPARRVRFGLQSAEEMAELWFQALPRRPEEAALLDRENQQKVIQAKVAYNRAALAQNPDDAAANAELGKALLFQGRTDDARRHLEAAVRLQPDADEPHYFLGLLHRTQDRLDEARADFEAAIRLNPGHAKAHGNLGLVLMQQGRLDAAAAAFEAALRLNPADEIARDSLEQIRTARRNRR